MGCDIHIYAETKKREYWHYTGDFWENPYFKEDQLPTDYNRRYQAEPYCGRNYNLFALLADVRNGYGFAGCDTGDAIIPISKPKGLPEDISDEIKAKSDYWDSDGHSHSWLTLKELVDANIERFKTARGWVGSKEFIEFKETGKPNGWCGGIGGPKIEHISNQEMLDRIISNKLTGNEYTQVEFKLDISDLLTPIIDNLKMLLKYVDEDPERIRVIFWFDN